jgi:hypothetical protein
MPLPLSAGDMTRIRRLERVNKVVPVNNEFDYFTALPNSNPTSTFVLACIDPRFAYALEKYLDQTYAQNGSSYDLFILAGASMGGNLNSNTATPPPGDTMPSCAIVSAGNNWRVALHNHIQVAIILHNVTQIVIIDHLNCGAYVNCNGATGGPNGDQVRDLHEDQFIALRDYINAESFFTNTSGTSAFGSTIFSSITGYYFDGVAAASTTSLLNIADGTPLSPAISEPKGTNSGARVLVLGCIDPRYSAVMTSFLNNYQDVQFIYDLFILAGASLGANQSYTTFPTIRDLGDPGSYPNNVLADDRVNLGDLGRSWGPTFFDHLSVAKLLHNITEVWVFDHLDCGAYKLILDGSLGATDDSFSPHLTEMQKLRANISSYTNIHDPINTAAYSLSFKGFIIDKSGKVSNVMNDGGVSLTNTILFGSSRIRNPASSNTDRIAHSRADYLTHSRAVCVPETNRTTLCPCTTTTHTSRVGLLRSSEYQHLHIQ